MEIVRATEKPEKPTSTKKPISDPTPIGSEASEPQHPDDADMDDAPEISGKKTKSKRGGKKRGKQAEDEVKRLLDEAFSLAWRVWDTRNFHGFGKGQMISAKVKSDFEAVNAWLDPENGVSVDSKHYYIEVKACKDRNSFPMYRSVQHKDKMHQWKWAQVCFGMLRDEYWYFIVNRHSPSMFYILMFDWKTLNDAFMWMESKSKRSIPWEKMKQLANVCLYQDEDATDDLRFVTPENVQSIHAVLRITEELLEVDYGF